MTQRDFFIDVFGFILAVFILRLLRLAITMFFVMAEDILRKSFPKYDSNLRDFFLKIDFVMNKMRILGIRWHFLLAFVYVVFMRLHSMHVI